MIFDEFGEILGFPKWRDQSVCWLALNLLCLQVYTLHEIQKFTELIRIIFFCVAIRYLIVNLTLKQAEKRGHSNKNTFGWFMLFTFWTLFFFINWTKITLKLVCKSTKWCKNPFSALVITATVALVRDVSVSTIFTMTMMMMMMPPPVVA